MKLKGKVISYKEWSEARKRAFDELKAQKKILNWMGEDGKDIMPDKGRKRKITKT